MTEKESKNFIEQEIDKDLSAGKVQGEIHTRFPPEPNGYLHIGHAKSICLNFGVAEKYNGVCNLRFDDTNPTKENIEYVDSIKSDVKWLGFDWGDREYYASDYFHELYGFAVKMIKEGFAYVDEQSADDIAKGKGSPTEPGIESPFRNRPVDESVDLFEQMKEGVVAEGKYVLRAKIDMASPNMHMRDPVIYRVKIAHHHRTGDEWKIYPMYDFAHGQSDALENITHSLCTLEFEVHRPLYNWFIEKIGVFPSRQIEFARLNLTYTILSKRKLLQLVEEGQVEGWDDPRMPTISGYRRRGFTANSIKNFANKIGVAKRDGIIDIALLEHSAREDLNKISNRKMAVLDPIKLIITNLPDGHVEQLPARNNPEDESAGIRNLPFSKEIFIDRSDFMVDPPNKYFRLAPGREVRLKYAYIIKCEDYLLDDNGEIKEIHCTYDPTTKSGTGVSRKVKGTLGWVNAEHAVNVEIRQYDRLFTEEDLSKADNFLDHINPESLEIIKTGVVEPSITDIGEEEHIQFERIGYFIKDRESTNDTLVLNRTVTLRDTWKK